MRRWLPLSSLLALALSACSSPPAPTPSAVITATPSSVCMGDDFATPILLDSGDSRGRLTLVPVPPAADGGGLVVRWSFAGSSFHVVEGDVHLPQLIVTLRGDRPLHVTLGVDNAEGGHADAHLTISVTTRDATGGCPLPSCDGGSC